MPPTAEHSAPRTAAATAARVRYLAERAAADPHKLAKAARIVRAAIADGRLTLDDLINQRGSAA